MKNLIKITVILLLVISVFYACDYPDKKDQKQTTIPSLRNSLPKTTNKILKIDNVEIFYREAGNPNNQTIVLLHGFPTSSNMYRDLIPLLSDKYHLIAPDYPGFGLSSAPKMENFDYTFENMSLLMEKFIDKLQLSSLYLFIQDYGGPIGMRIATKRPELIKGLIIQNANAYEEGLGPWAKKIGNFVQSKDFKGLNEYKNYLFSLEGIKSQYITGAKQPDVINPISYLTDAALMQRKGINEIQTALFNDYKSNFPKYKGWQNYLKQTQPPTLVIWGQNDPFFSKAGAEAYKKDLENPTIHLFDGGHFMLEEYAYEASILIKEFIK